MQSSSGRAALRSILFADLADYSRLAARKELETLEFVSRCFDLFRTNCQAFGGEFIKNTGDGVLILFEGVSSAIDYALFMQAELEALVDAQSVSGWFRIALHAGEVHRRDGDAFGHAVNVAARVQAYADPGGVCVTQEVYWAARNIERFGFRFVGRPALKNIPEQLALYHVVSRDEIAASDHDQSSLVAVIDGLRVYRGDGEEAPVRSRKAQALIGHLALSRDLQDVQDRIAALIWPDRAPAAARHALASCLHVAEKSIEADAIFHRGSLVGLRPTRVAVDVQRMLRDLEEGKVDDLLLQRSDWAEAILYGLEETGELFSAWLSVTRHNCRDHALEALEALLERFDAAEPAMRRAASALLVLEPSHERAARCLIRHHAASQNMPAAIRVYEKLCDVLQDRYALEPSTETKALAMSLARPEVRPTPVPPRPRRGGPAPVLAIGTFRWQGVRASPVVLGFRSELVANLSKFREFTVVEAADEALDRSHADYLLTADCTDADQDIGLAVVLADPGTGRVVWGESLQVTLENWRSSQKQLVARIASTLEVYLSHDRLARGLQRLPEDLGVYDMWLRGENLLTRWAPEAEDEAERLFETAIAADPTFAPAHASLASIYNSRQFIRPGSVSEPGAAGRALDLAQRSVALDPLDARNHLVVAWSTAMARHFEQAEVHYELAVDLNPHSPKTLVSAGLGLAFAGRAEIAMSLVQRAMSLSPIFLNYQWSHMATVRYLAGDFEGAVECSDRSQSAIIDTVGWKAAALMKLDRLDEAFACLSQLCASVEAVWAGPSPASHDDVIDWFLSAFPIRRDTDRSDLARLRLLEPKGDTV